MSLSSQPEGLAAGWYIALPSSALPRHRPVALELFGRPLVAWRDGTGKAVVMERFCPHMGANLAAGRIVEGTLQCPFHGWRFGEDGRCAHAPRVERIPPRAVVGRYPMLERFGYVWVWYGTPEPLFELPAFPPLEQERRGYMEARFQQLLPTTPLRALENAYDNYHFKHVHDVGSDDAGSDGVRLELELPPTPESSRFAGVLQADSQKLPGLFAVLARAVGLDVRKIEIGLESWPSGHHQTTRLNGKLLFTNLVAVAPIRPQQTRLHLVMMARRTGNPLVDSLAYLVLCYQTRQGIQQDLSIWSDIRPDRGGAYTRLDRGVLEFRRFYQRWAARVAESAPLASTG